MIESTPEPRRGRAGRIRFLVGFVVILGAVGFLVARGAKNAMVYYITVTELLQKDRGADLAGLRVKGNVVPGTIEHGDLVLRFEISDGVTAVPVTYRGIVPDTFGENGEVVVEGSLAGGQFEADFLMAKCPSKYEAEMDEGGTEPPVKSPTTTGA
jgi:cytochrome c-type biogenesis protein CcmE